MEYEKLKALRALKVWYAIFAIFFIVFTVSFITFGSSITNQIRAYNECSRVDDSHFQACYDDKR